MLGHNYKWGKSIFELMWTAKVEISLSSHPVNLVANGQQIVRLWVQRISRTFIFCAYCNSYSFLTTILWMLEDAYPLGLIYLLLFYLLFFSLYPGNARIIGHLFLQLSLFSGYNTQNNKHQPLSIYRLTKLTFGFDSYIYYSYRYILCTLQAWLPETPAFHMKHIHSSLEEIVVYAVNIYSWLLLSQTLIAQTSLIQT